MLTTKEETCYVDGKLADVSICIRRDGTLGAQIHWRSNGYTGQMPVTAIHDCWNQAEAVGGHCRWQELHLYYGNTKLVLTPNQPQTFKRLIEEAWNVWDSWIAMAS